MKKVLLNRKREALRRAAMALAALLVMNHVMHIGMPLPRLAYHKLEERAGVGWTQVVKRVWVPDMGKTHIAYFSGDETATVFGSVSFSLYGWMPYFGIALDCSKDEPLYAGYNRMSGKDGLAWFFFGRVDDPEIKEVHISVCDTAYDAESHAYAGEEFFRQRAELIERGGRRYFFLQASVVMDTTETRPMPMVLGYDGAGNALLQYDIDEGSHSYFG